MNSALPLKSIYSVIGLILLLTLMSATVYGQEIAAQPAANLDQVRNGSAGSPNNPGVWVNGNLNQSQAHYREGNSVPYRAVLTDVPLATTIWFVIEFDNRSSGRSAIDYLTSYNRLGQHNPTYGHDAETIDPTIGTPFSGQVGSPTDTAAIPAPSSLGSPVPGMPTDSFNALTAAEKLVTMWGATFTGTKVQLVSQGSWNVNNASTLIQITLVTSSDTVVVAWGGHIASRGDWGYDPGTGAARSAGGVGGSPYHMRLISWNLGNLGNQDRSLSGSAVTPAEDAPTCGVQGVSSVCESTVGTVFSSTVTPQTATLSWSISGNGSISGATNLPTVTVNAGTSGSYTVTLTATSNGGSTTCSQSVTINANPTCSISGAGSVCAGTTGQVYSGPGGMSVYSWGISGNGVITAGTNTQNVTVTAGAAGSFTLTLNITDANGCSSSCNTQVTVNANPVCSITGAGSVCASSTEHVYSAPGNMSVYSWSISGNGAINGANNAQDVTVSATDAGSFTLTLNITDINGCSSSCNTQVTVNANPVCSISGAPTACENTVGNVYSAPANMTAYNWGISGDGVIVGPTDQRTVTVTAGSAGSFTLTLNITNANGCNSSCETEVTTYVCGSNATSFTQGFWGNSGGKFNGMTTLQLLDEIFGGGNVVVGKPADDGSNTARALVITDGKCVIKRLPAGGPAAALPEGLGVQTTDSSCNTDPQLPLQKKGDKFRNVFLGQVIALSLNVRLTDNPLGDWAFPSTSGSLTPAQFCTQGALPGPDGKLGTSDDVVDPFSSIESYTISASVLNALDALSLPKTVNGLLELANRALAGWPTGGATIGEINAAVDTINNAFDKCRFVVPCP